MDIDDMGYGMDMDIFWEAEKGPRGREKWAEEKQGGKQNGKSDG